MAIQLPNYKNNLLTQGSSPTSTQALMQKSAMRQNVKNKEADMKFTAGQNALNRTHETDTINLQNRFTAGQNQLNRTQQLAMVDKQGEVQSNLAEQSHGFDLENKSIDYWNNKQLMELGFDNDKDKLALEQNYALQRGAINHDYEMEISKSNNASAERIAESSKKIAERAQDFMEQQYEDEQLKIKKANELATKAHAQKTISELRNAEMLLNLGKLTNQSNDVYRDWTNITTKAKKSLEMMEKKVEVINNDIGITFKDDIGKLIDGFAEEYKRLTTAPTAEVEVPVESKETGLTFDKTKKFGVGDYNIEGNNPYNFKPKKTGETKTETITGDSPLEQAKAIGNMIGNKFGLGNLGDEVANTTLDQIEDTRNANNPFVSKFNSKLSQFLGDIDVNYTDLLNINKANNKIVQGIKEGKIGPDNIMYAYTAIDKMSGMLQKYKNTSENKDSNKIISKLVGDMETIKAQMISAQHVYNTSDPQVAQVIAKGTTAATGGGIDGLFSSVVDYSVAKGLDVKVQQLLASKLFSTIRKQIENLEASGTNSDRLKAEQMKLTYENQLASIEEMVDTIYAENPELIKMLQKK